MSQESIPVPRNRIFVLSDGTFVVQWEENRVQDLLHGRYTTYEDSLYGSSITDYELSQLQQSGIVSAFDQELVYLEPSPTLVSSAVQRAFYLNTTLDTDYLDEVEHTVQQIAADDYFSIRVRHDFVVIWRKNGSAFTDFDDAERHREQLLLKAPELFRNLSVAFTEVIPIR